MWKRRLLMKPSSQIMDPEDASANKKSKCASRRSFLGQVAGAATVASLAGTLRAPVAKGQQTSPSIPTRRALASFNNRTSAATRELEVRTPPEITNGDETRFPNYIGNYSKGLIHNSIGQVSPASYGSLLAALNSGEPQLFNEIQLGGNTLLVDPQAGLAFDLEGTDSHQLAIGTPPSVASRAMADTMVESYWMSLCRDVNFTQYGNEPISQAAIKELNSLPAFAGPRPVTPQNLFRGFTPGDVVGPYPSQFILQPLTYGAIPITQMMTTYAPGLDYMTDRSEEHT